MMKVVLWFCTAVATFPENATAYARPPSLDWGKVSRKPFSGEEQPSVAQWTSVWTLSSKTEGSPPRASPIKYDGNGAHLMSRARGRNLAEADPSDNCSNLLDAIGKVSSTFREALDESTKIVTREASADLGSPSATFTVLVPPAAQLDALLAAFRAGDIDRAAAQDTVLLHIIPQRLRVADLRALGAGAAVPTLNHGANLTLALPGSGAIAFELPGGGRAAVAEADLRACGVPSVLHRVDMLITAAAVPLPPGVASRRAAGGSEGRGSAGLIVGVALACLALLSVAVAAAVFLRRRWVARARHAARGGRRKDPVPAPRGDRDCPKLLPLGMRLPSRSDVTERGASGTLSHSWNPVATLSEFSCDGDGDTDAVSESNPRQPGTHVQRGGASHVGMAAVSLSATTGDPSSSTQSAQRTAGTLFSTAGTPSGASVQRATEAATATPPLPGARAEERRQWLHNQLDCISSAPLLQRFVLLGPAERRASDGTLVQFARSVGSEEEFALKFFISREKFEAERTVFAHWILGAMLPRLEGMYDNRDGALQDPRGHALPPCVIMERGESLRDWFQRRRPDLRTALPVVAHIAKRAAGMHRGGYVHRDLKPSNIMWLPRDSQWTLIDFGAAVEIGRPAPLKFTLPYAAPEAVAAWNGGRTGITATHALDAWALGVVFFEMVTRRKAFSAEPCHADQVREALLGQGPLPWDRLSSEDRRRLGPLKGPLLLLLQRDPRMRPSLDLFYHKCVALIK